MDSSDLTEEMIRSLILALRAPEEKVRASAWLRRLNREQNCEQRSDYLKLLLFSLHRLRLGGPFARSPPASDQPLPRFPDGWTLTDIARRLMLLDSSQEDRSGEVSPMVQEVSGDHKEYVAVQSFQSGAHGFLAVSPEPVNAWDGADVASMMRPPKRTPPWGDDAYLRLDSTGLTAMNAIDGGLPPDWNPLASSTMVCRPGQYEGLTDEYSQSTQASYEPPSPFGSRSRRMALSGGPLRRLVSPCK